MRKYLLGFIVLLVAGSTSLFAQKKKDTDFHISIEDDDVDIEIVIDELAEAIEQAFESFDGDMSFHINDDDIDIKVNNINVDWDEFGENIERAIETAVKNMTIEMKDLDPEEIKYGDSEICDVELRDIIYEIEDEYNREVENVDRMELKFDNKYVYLTLDVTLENGKEVRNIKRKIRND